MSEPDEHALVCPPAAIYRRPDVPARTRKCSECNMAAWVSRVMLPVVDRNEVLVVCFFCVQAVRSRHSATKWGVHPAQREDAKDDPRRLAHLEEVARRHQAAES